MCFVSDCAMVVDGFAKGRRWATSWRRLQAYRWTVVFDLIKGWDSDAVSVLKVKAHRTASQRDELSDVERGHWWGNYYADRWAKVGANAHRAEAAARAALATGRSHYCKVASWAASVVREEAAERPWAREGARWQAFRPVVARSSATVARHVLEPVGGVWRCVNCPQWALTELSRRRLKSLPCGGPLEARAARASARASGALGAGHALMRSDPMEQVQDVGFIRPGMPIVWCSSCGAYAEEAPRNLLRACPGRPSSSSGRSAIRWLWAGWHPRKYRRYAEPRRVEAVAEALFVPTAAEEAAMPPAGVRAPALMGGGEADDAASADEAVKVDAVPPRAPPARGGVILGDGAVVLEQRPTSGGDDQWWREAWGRLALGFPD